MGDKIKVYKISAWESERKGPRRKPSRSLAENKNEDLLLNINQLGALSFYSNFISSLYMFRAHVLETCRGLK